MKIALIIDKSEVFVNFEKEKILKQWGVSASEISKISHISEAGGMTLFGPAPTSLLENDDLDELKALTKELESLIDNKSIEGHLSTGVVITTTIPRRSTKKLEALVESLGGIVVFSEEKTGSGVARNLVKSINFSKDVKTYLLEYVGNDYEALVPIIRSISNLSPARQKKITVEDMYLRLPKPPGSIPPWDVEKPLLSGDASKTIETYRRIAKNSHYLTVVFILRKKVSVWFKVASLIEIDGIRNRAEISEKLGVPNTYALTLAINNAKRFGLDKMLKLNFLLEETSKKTRGGSSVNGSSLVEIMLIEFVRIVRS